MLRTVSIAIFAAVAVQAQAADPPAFDVASVKASQRAPERGWREPIQATPGSLTMRGVTLKASIAWAYHVLECQVSGPGWMGEQRYDVMAKAAGPAGEPELRRMLQSLLADRFQLALHRQNKEMAAYVLTVGKNGPKFAESKSEGDSGIEPDRKTMSITAHRVSVAQVIGMLSQMYQAPVIDQTGLAGRYDVTIDARKYIPQSGEKTDPFSIIETGLQQELGLKLESRKMAVDLLIVDRVEKAPVEN